MRLTCCGMSGRWCGPNDVVVGAEAEARAFDVDRLAGAGGVHGDGVAGDSAML